MVDLRKPGQVSGLGVNTSVPNKKIDKKDSSQGKASAGNSSFVSQGKGQSGSKSGGLMRSGAMGIFSDGVVFPQNLLDPNNAKNDPKYLRLLSAALGMDELEWHFKTREEEDQEEYIERKEKRRVQRAREKEEEKQNSSDESGEAE